MPEVTITYENPKTLKILKGLSKYFDFSVLSPKTNKRSVLTIVNGVTMMRKSNDIDAIDSAAMSNVMERSNMDANALRSKWTRKK